MARTGTVRAAHASDAEAMAEARKNFPEFTATRSRDFPGWLLVWCPRDECGKLFLVERQPWYQGAGRAFKTRSCPYCFKASALPPPRRIGRATRD